jgi:hypothetical protein
MGLKYAHIVPFIFIIGLLIIAAVSNAQSPATPQPSQINPGDIKGAVVTLYYYDPVTGGKGAIVPLPDGQNPQEVIWDETKAAPGTYTFYKVPQGNYYVEAVDQGTSTANVAIPPYNDTGFLAIPSPQATPSTSPTAIPPKSASPTPAPTPQVTPSPGMTTLAALTGLTLVALYVVTRRK